MNIISREDFNDLNEAVLGIRNRGYHLDSLSETEFQEIIKYLILLSGGSQVCETHIKQSLLDYDLVSESKFDNINFTQLINESVNEGDYTDMIDTGLKATAAAVTVGAVGLGSYISFLFKKKKIRKAMEKLKDARIEKADIGKETYDEIQAMKPKLTKEEGDKEIEKIKTKVADLELELGTFDSKIKTERDDLKSQKDDVIKDLKVLDSNEGGTEKPKVKKPEVKKPEVKKPEGINKEVAAPGVKKPKTKTESNSLEEADKESKKGKEGKEGTGKIYVAKADLDNAKNSEDEKVQKEKNLVTKERLQIEQEIKKVKEKGSDKKSKDKIDKLGKQKTKLQDTLKDLEEKGTGEVEKAQQKVDKIKSDIASQKANLVKVKSRLRELTNPEKIKSEKDAIRDKIAGTKEEREQVETDMKPTGTTQEFKDAEEAGKAKKEQVEKDIKTLQTEVDRVSGTEQDEDGKTKSSGLVGKATGFSTKFVKKLRGEHDAEVMDHEKDLLQQMEDSRKADLKSKQIKKAEDKAKDADKELDDEKKKVDASDSEKKEAEEKVKIKQQEQDVENKEKENEAKDAKKKAIQAQIEKLKQKVSKAENDVEKVKTSGNDPDKVKKAEYKLNSFNDKLKGAEDAYNKIGEHFSVKYQLALLESELKQFAIDFDIILEEQPATMPDVPTDQEEDIKEEPKDKNEGKKVVITNVLGTELSGYEGSKGVIVKGFEEGEREPEGDLPRRAGDPEIFKIKLDEPKDPMYTSINLTKDKFKEIKDNEKKEERVTIQESTTSDFRSKFYTAVNENNKE